VNRDQSLARLEDTREEFDVLVIGGGATGSGIALDAATRGYRTVLFERDDFGKGTSSRSTKLIHGGVRYLQQGDVALVRHALRERATLLRNAPRLVKPLRFVLPVYGWGERLFYGTGLFLYDRLAGSDGGFNKSRLLSTKETIAALPTVRTAGLHGSWMYEDAQFDDARLLIEILHAASANGATLVNYASVEGLLRSSLGQIRGAAVRDRESGRTYEIGARVVINAAGAFCDAIRSLAEPDEEPLIVPSQGTHIVVDHSFLASDNALIIPRTPDGRVLFLIPWHGHTLIGTTETPIPQSVTEPRPLAQELDFLLETAGEYLTRAPVRADVLSTWAGIRPLVRARTTTKTASLSRDHTILIEPSGLITITGGKWTTYRLMAEDCVNRAAEAAGLARRACVTPSVSLSSEDGESDPIVHAIRNEMARTVEDVLARRTRLLFLNAREAMECAPAVAAVLAQELGRDQDWEQRQVREFNELARGYLPDPA
jgi:glycerol-3-phosphate dehydrogenase